MNRWIHGKIGKTGSREWEEIKRFKANHWMVEKTPVLIQVSPPSRPQWKGSPWTYSDNKGVGCWVLNNAEFGLSETFGVLCPGAVVSPPLCHSDLYLLGFIGVNDYCG